MLLLTRQWLLEKYTHVKLARKLSDLSALIQEEIWDIAILCHTLDIAERRTAIELLTTMCPHTKLISLLPISVAQSPYALDNACIPATGSAKELVSVVEGLLASCQMYLQA